MTPFVGFFLARYTRLSGLKWLIIGLDCDVYAWLISFDCLQAFLNTLHLLRELSHLSLSLSLLVLDISQSIADI